MAREVSAALPSASRRVSLAKLVIGRERLAEECGVSVKTLYKYLNTLGSYVSLAPAEVIEAFLLMKCRGIHFYTFPPGDTPWLWLLVNVFTVDLLADLLELYRSLGIKTYAISVIVDSGVDRYWRKPCSAIHADYTEDYWNTFWSAVDKVKILRKEFGFFYEVVVPDYVDDYSSAWGKKHCLWIDNYTNIDRTLENVFYMIEQDKNIKWLTPAQGYEDVPESILKSIGVYVNHGLHKKYRIGLANLCTSKKTSVILETVRLAREVCKECRYHIFGPSLTAVKKSIALGYMQPGDSWDSTAWTFPRGNGWSCKSSRERVQYFLFYLRHVVEGLRGGGGAQRKAHE
jgi:hypothetical protein